MSKEIVLKSIGIAHTPYQHQKGMPIQGIFEEQEKATIEIYEPFVEGLKDIEGFSHLMLFYQFHQVEKEQLRIQPYLEDVEHGVFAVRTPLRVNRLGFSIVKLEQVKGPVLHISQVDLLDGTPIIDIKPYVSYFDQRCDVKNGWIEKHFQNGANPSRVRVSDQNIRD